jgi:CheY-like chemotaxis protein
MSPGTENLDKPPVLVVEDDQDTQMFMQTLLGQHYEVLLAESGDQARRHLKVNPEIRMVLMDISLKGREDGLTLARYLRSQEKWREVPIIATTAHAFPEDRMNCMAAGCDAYFGKPFSPRKLLTLMDRLIADPKSVPREPFEH